MKERTHKRLSALVTAVFAGAVLAGTGALQAAESSPLIGPSADECATLANLSSEHPASSARLQAVYNHAAQSSTGSFIAGYVRGQGDIQICMAPSSADPAQDEYMTAGEFSSKYNRVNIGAAPKLTPGIQGLVLVHELRHRMQLDAGLDEFAPGNIPEEQRISLMLFREADARLMGILHAYEMAQRGDNEAVQFMLRDEDQAVPYRAFADVLRQDPTNMTGAMRAAVRSFLQDVPEVKAHYAMRAMDTIGPDALFFMPYYPAEKAFSDEAVKNLGHATAYGSYIEESLLQAVRDSYSRADYEGLEKRWTDQLRTGTQALVVSP